MDERRKRADWPIIAVLIVVLAIVPLYVGGYFWLPETRTVMLSLNISGSYEIFPRKERSFPSKWLATVYTPAGMIEGYFTGIRVEVDSK